MLYIYSGTDKKNLRAKADTLLRALLAKSPDADLLRITDEEVENINIQNLLASQGLFKSNLLLFFDNVALQLAEENEDLFKTMAESGHVCIIYEDTLPQKVPKSAYKHATKTIKADIVNKPSDKYNVFELANAIKQKNKKQAWLALVKARDSGAQPEAIVGMIFWALKDMVVKKRYGKFSESEVMTHITTIAELPHKTRVSGGEMYAEIERWLLGL